MTEKILYLSHSHTSLVALKNADFMKKVSFLVFALSVGLFANAQNFSIGPVAGTGNGWTNYKENEYGTLEKDPAAPISMEFNCYSRLWIIYTLSTNY